MRNAPFVALLLVAARAGLAAQRERACRYRLPGRPIGLRAGVDLTHALRMAKSLEDEEIVRRHEVRE